MHRAKTRKNKKVYEYNFYSIECGNQQIHKHTPQSHIFIFLDKLNIQSI